MSHTCEGDPCRICGGMSIPPDIAKTLQKWIDAGAPMIVGEWHTVSINASPFVKLEPRADEPIIVESK